jgi:hypothetical protein
MVVGRGMGIGERVCRKDPVGSGRRERCFVSEDSRGKAGDSNVAICMEGER